MTDPFVSVIIPTYNRAKFIGKAIDSVLSQTYSDWELIIWIDGSTDETEQIVQSYQDERLKYYYEENHGKCYALNRSIELSKGTWVAILDDDDQWRQTKLQSQVEAVNKHPQIDVLFTNFTNLNESSGEQGFGFDQNKRGLDKLTLNRLQDEVFLISDKFPEGFSTANFILPSSIIIRKSVFQIVGLFNESLRNAEDAELWWRIYLHDYSFAYCERVLVDRIKPKGSLSSASLLNSLNVIRSIESILQELKRFNRQDLQQLMYASTKNAYLGIAREYLLLGEMSKAFSAFKKSLSYGVKYEDLSRFIKQVLQSKVKHSIG